MTEEFDSKRRPPRLADVAELAQVAKSTVSRVLLGEKTLNIRQDTRQRVLDAIESLGYRPDVRARGLKTRRSFSIGLVVPEIDNPAFTTIIKGAQRAALARDYSLLIAFVDAEYPDQALYRRLVDQNQVDGLLVTTIQNPSLTAELRSLGKPYVLVNRELGQNEHTVIVDYQAGTRQAVATLVAFDHRNIAYISGPLEHYTGRTRLSGFIEGHAACGLRYDVSRVSACDYSRGGAEAAMEAQLAHPAGPPTAVCAANVVIAAAILSVAMRHGMAVPRDLSVLALLDSPAADMLSPAIGAVQYPFFELGYEAANDLMDIADGRAQPIQGKVLAPFGVLERHSIGRCHRA